jgi:hypothetical protein
MIKDDKGLMDAKGWVDDLKDDKGWMDVKGW